MTIRNLEHLFRPRSVALVGTGSAIDTLVARNLIGAGFKGPVMPVIGGCRAIEGILAYGDVDSLPMGPDLAVITTPLKDVPALIGQLGERGARAAIILTEGVPAPPKAERKALKQAVLDAASPYTLRVLGPGSVGVYAPAHGLNTLVSRVHPLSGDIAVVTQSAAITRATADWATTNAMGFSHLICLGGASDVDFGDTLDYLANDYTTRAVLLHLERVRDPRKFMSAARRAARTKPVIVLKPRQYSAKDADDAVYDAAFRRSGILRVADLEELLNSVETLGSAKPVRPDHSLTIVGNSRSLALLATNTLERHGGELASLSADTRTELEELVDPVGTSGNPIDLGDSADADAYGRALDLLLADKQADSVLVINSPNTLGNDAAIAEAVAARATKTRKPLFASWVGELTGEDGRKRLQAQRVPAYRDPGEAVLAFMRMVEYKRNQELLMETPPSTPEVFAPDVVAARQIIQRALSQGRAYLDEYEAPRLLAAYGIPVADTHRAGDPDEAAEIADRVDGPVALKILSPDIAQKSDVRGVMLDLKSADTVKEAAHGMISRVRDTVPEARIEGFVIQPMIPRDDAYELTVGIRHGGRFGPVIRFGQGGTEVEAIRDIAYGLPPLNMHLATELISRTRIYTLFKHRLLRTADLETLALTLIKLSQMVIDIGEVQELDINPLWANSQGVIALDARVEVAPFEGNAAERLAIRPYPAELEEEFKLPDGRTLCLRPVLPEDEPALHALVGRIPPDDLRLRFFRPMRELSHDMAARLTQLDYNREMALVVTDRGSAGQVDIYGMVSLNADSDNEEAEYAILVDRNMGAFGLGPILMRRIVHYARERGIRRIVGEVMRENSAMLRLDRAMGFKVSTLPDDPSIMHVTLEL